MGRDGSLARWTKNGEGDWMGGKRGWEKENVIQRCRGKQEWEGYGKVGFRDDMTVKDSYIK